MYRNIMRNTTLALGTLLMSSTLVLAGSSLHGEVRSLDGKGMATIHTTDGKDHQVKAGTGWKVGAKVECESKNNVMECQAPAPQAAVTPAPAKATPAPAPTAASTVSSPAPAPSTSTPAPVSK
jgi:hypothetical protein